MQPGELFQEKYRIVGQLGTGGQSRVFRADELATGRRVAIKLLHEQGDGVRFIREGRVVSRLQSAHTVRLIEFDRAVSGQWFMVFEFVAGENLRVVAQREAPLPWPRVARLMYQVLEALAEAHAAGIIHRDIKPSNIMVAPGDEAKVLDFGVARLTSTSGDGITQPGEVLGTPRYTAPEALSGGEVTAAVDVYGLGLVAWELLVGRPANDARPGADIVLRHLDPTPFRLPLDIDIPDEARRWVTKMCEKQPDRRPQDAAAALAMLEAFEAPPAPLVERGDPDASYEEDLETRVLETDERDVAPPRVARPDLDPTDPEPWKPDEVLPHQEPGEVVPQAASGRSPLPRSPADGPQQEPGEVVPRSGRGLAGRPQQEPEEVVPQSGRGPAGRPPQEPGEVVPQSGRGPAPPPPQMASTGIPTRQTPAVAGPPEPEVTAPPSRVGRVLAIAGLVVVVGLLVIWLFRG